MKTMERTCRKDPDVLDGEFDEDADGYANDLARNGRPLNYEL